MSDHAHQVLWRRLKYQLTPQWDIYKSLPVKLKNKTVLEVGFGTGAGVLQYLGNVLWVDAIEVDPGAVVFAKETFPLPKVNWMEADIATYKTHKRYGGIVAIETLEHVEEWPVALENIYKILDKGGVFIMTARNANADLRRHKDLHVYEWTAKKFKQVLDKYFDVSYVYDYSLTQMQGEDTSLTPLVGIARKEYP